MIISLNWLKTYIPVDIDPADLAERLTMTGLEVEALFDRMAYLNDVVVGRVTEIAAHPKADKLKICRVDIGGRNVSVVCGAPNVETGGRYPCALPGAELPGGLTVEASAIRGEKSEGMLCSERELELGKDASGLMPMDSGLSAGQPLKKALNLSDMVFEIGLTPNRPDCLSFIGIAREVAALTGAPLRLPAVELPHNSGAIDALAAVDIQAPELCPRYATRLVTEIQVGPSPFWLQDRLHSIGLKPINNIVDITNFIMMETGQPLHAFDFDRLAGHRIVVRTAGAREPFTTLDGKQHELSDETLMICDAEKPVAVAGVMGGENSEIGEDTARVLIESACFDPVSIRKTAKRLGINTDASHRFERGVDPEVTLYALERAARLMVDLAGGSLVEGLIDAYPRPFESRPIELDPERANRHLGTALSETEMQELLESVEFKVSPAENGRLSVLAPSFRVDVSRPEDLMEEVARLWGYNRIVTTFPKTQAQQRLPDQARRTKERITDMMCGFGFNEAINYSFMAKDACDRLSLAADDERRRLLDILNPLSEEQAVMRTSLVPGLLETMRRNLAFQIKDVRLFETGKTFLSNGQDRLPEETETLAALWTGSGTPATWQSKARPCDFYDLKGVVESLLDRLNTPAPAFTPLSADPSAYMRAGRSARIQVAETEIGRIGEVDPEVLKTYDLKQTAYIMELNIHRLLPLIPEAPQFTPIPRFPAAWRDVTLIVDNAVLAGDILASVYNKNEPLLEDVRIFDLYSGPPIAEDKKSLSIRLTYRSAEETLADETVNRVHEDITGHLIHTFNASLPT